MIPVSNDIKARIPVLKQLGFKVTDICEILGVKKALVYSVLRLFERTGQTHECRKRAHGRRRILTGLLLAAFREVTKQNPTAHHDELRMLFLHEHGVDLSRSTISRTLRQLRHTRKKVVLRAREANPVLQAVYINRFAKLVKDPWMPIFLDESAKDERTIIRRYGYGPEGERILVDAPFVRGKRVSMLPALTLDGIITHIVVEGSVTSEKFVEFLRDFVVHPSIFLLVCIYLHILQMPLTNPYPGPRSVLILDNCNIHHAEEVRVLVEEEFCEYLQCFESYTYAKACH
jgi:transposase